MEIKDRPKNVKQDKSYFVPLIAMFLSGNL